MKRNVLTNPKLDWLKISNLHNEENAKMVVSNQFGDNVENAKVALSK